jgi:protocatechuate 3,4-dioxygenase beta subunit
VFGTSAWLVLISVALLTGFQEDPSQPASIHGQVVRAGTTEPLTKAVVELVEADAGPVDSLTFFVATPATLASRRTAISTRTDSRGEFSFAGVRPGRYRLSVLRDGYSRTEYLQLGNNDRGAVIAVGEGQVLEDLMIEMKPAGTIAGAVRDQAGRPIAHMTVAAYDVLHLPGGGRQLRFVQSEETNDLGEYRLYWLTPGDYYVGVDYGYGRDVTTVVRQNIVEPHVRYPTYYYPNTPGFASAQAVEVREGLTTEGIDFELKEVRLPSVRGSVVSAQGSPSPTRVQLASTFLPESSRYSESRIAPDGSFEIANVPEGRHLLGAGQNLIPVDVGASDLEGVNLRLAAAVPIKGRMRMEDADSATPRSGVSLHFLGPHGELDGFAAELDETGAFTARGWPGEFEVSVEKLPESHFVKSVTVLGRNILEENLILSSSVSGPVELDIVLGRNDGIVVGSVTGVDNRPIAGAIVVLIPTGVRRQFIRYRRTTTDATGHFEIRGAAPGEYAVYAFEDAAGEVYYDPQYISTLTGHGEELSVQQEADATVHLRLIPRGR